MELLPRAVDRGERSLPADEFTWPETKGVLGYNDITPRMGVVYDLFGTGRTALKFNAGKYLEAAVNGNGNYSALLPTSRIDLTQSRSWTDSNGNFIPDCDLTSPLAQNLTASGGDVCGQWANPNFGKAVDANGNPIYSLGYAEKILKGWGTRPSDWQFGVTLQQQILPRVSVEVGYSRRWLQNFTVTDNLSVAPGGLRSVQSRRAVRFRGCPAAAAIRSLGSTTSSRTSSRWQRTTCAPTRPTTGRSRRSTTVSTSTSTHAYETVCSCRPARRRDSASPTIVTFAASSRSKRSASRRAAKSRPTAR